MDRGIFFCTNTLQSAFQICKQHSKTQTLEKRHKILLPSHYQVVTWNLVLELSRNMNINLTWIWEPTSKGSKLLARLLKDWENDLLCFPKSFTKFKREKHKVVERENDCTWSIIAETWLLSCLITRVASVGSSASHGPKQALRPVLQAKMAT